MFIGSGYLSSCMYYSYDTYLFFPLFYVFNLVAVWGGRGRVTEAKATLFRWYFCTNICFKS